MTVSNEPWRPAQHPDADATGQEIVGLDLRFLDDATRSLLGYFVHTWFRKYLALLFDNIGRYIEHGIAVDLATPTDIGRFTMLFDFQSIDLDRLAYVNGIYWLSCPIRGSVLTG